MTVWASSAITSPLTACTGDALRGRLRRPARRTGTSAAAVTNSSVTTAPGGQRLAHRLRALGQERPGPLPGSARLASCRAALTRGDRTLVISLPAIARRPRPWSCRRGPRLRGQARRRAQAARCRRPGRSGSAFLATSTSAENAGGSLTASSASIRRSTSTPAIFRPWMNRL